MTPAARRIEATYSTPSGPARLVCWRGSRLWLRTLDGWRLVEHDAAECSEMHGAGPIAADAYERHRQHALRRLDAAARLIDTTRLQPRQLAALARGVQTWIDEMTHEEDET